MVVSSRVARLPVACTYYHTDVGAGVSDAIDRTCHDDLNDARKRLGLVADLAKGLAKSASLMAGSAGFKTFIKGQQGSNWSLSSQQGCCETPL